jgi:hypothetical protein
LDNLVRGTILAAYDFARLTAAGFLFPFVFRTRRFWPGVRSLLNRLSPLTYLLLWALIAISYGSGHLRGLTSTAIGSDKADVALTTAIAVALLLTVSLDLAIRAGSWLIRTGAKRKMYEPLMRVAAANIFAGFCLVTWLDQAEMVRPWADLVFMLGEVPIINPLISLFTGSLIVVLWKAFSIRRLAGRAVAAVLIFALVPIALVVASIGAFIKGYNIAENLYPKPARARASIVQQLPRCSVVAGQLRFSGYLKLVNAPSSAISAARFAVYTPGSGSYLGKPLNAYLGRFRGDDVVLSDSAFTRVERPITFEPVPASGKPADEGFHCVLKLVADDYDSLLSSFSVDLTEAPKKKDGESPRD